MRENSSPVFGKSIGICVCYELTQGPVISVCDDLAGLGIEIEGDFTIVILHCHEDNEL
jgi:hypothetical protein